MPRTIEVGDDVFEELQRIAVPLVDTADSVLRRVLGLSSPTLDPRGHSLVETLGSPGIPTAAEDSQLPDRWDVSERPTERPRRGTLLAEAEYFTPILEVLNELGGSAAASRVIERVGKKLEPKFTSADLGSYQSGEARWRKRTQFARYALVNKGLMRDDSPHGVWEISPAGESFLAGDAGG